MPSKNPSSTIGKMEHGSLCNEKLRILLVSGVTVRNTYVLFHFRLKKAGIAFENMFEEVPINIRNSYLINVLLWELEKKSAVVNRHELLSLASK